MKPEHHHDSSSRKLQTDFLRLVHSSPLYVNIQPKMGITLLGISLTWEASFNEARA